MKADDYQKMTAATAIYPRSSALEYTTLGLVSEAGEVAGKVKKAIRDDLGALTGQRREEIVDELGDVLWYAARLADELDVPLSVVMEGNLRKLYDRKERDVLGGSGDNR